MSIYRRTDRVPVRDFPSGEDALPPLAPPVAPPGAPPVAPQAPEADWTKRRTAEPANGLLKPTFTWASTLPLDVQPRALLFKFPRIANLIAALWQDPNSLRRYVDDLLVDKRGSRQGFPLDVLRELFRLRAHYDELHPASARPWESAGKLE